MGECITETAQTLVVGALRFSPHKTSGIPQHTNVCALKNSSLEGSPGVLFLGREANINTTPFVLYTLNRMSRALSSYVLLAFTKAIRTARMIWLICLRERDSFEPNAARCLVTTSTSKEAE